MQIVLGNPDAMPHDLVIGQPGSLEEIGTKAASMPMPTDPDIKAFVPDTPLVLFATRLLNGGETERLNTAPARPGEYVFVCTFPGPWVRMSGLMLVVDNLEAWEAKPTVPTDPVTKKPFAKQRHSRFGALKLVVPTSSPRPRSTCRTLQRALAPLESARCRTRSTTA